MLKGKALAKWLVVTIVALLAGFAPIFHSICIEATQNGSASHVMADGTVMVMSSSSDSKSSQATHVNSEIPTPMQEPGLPNGGDPFSLVAMFIVPACLLLVGLLIVVRKSVVLGIMQRFYRFQSARPPTWLHFPNAVNQVALSISRT